MSEITIIVRMSVYEQEQLCEKMEKFRNSTSQIDDKDIIKETKEFIDNMMESAFYDGLQCRFEDTFNKPKKEEGIVMDKNVLLMKPEEHKKEDIINDYPNF